MSVAVKITFAILLACAALGAGLVMSAAPSLAPPLQSVVFEGPGGRIPLTQWTLRKDAANHGLALGWQQGGFAGRHVSLPNVVSPTPYTGHAGARNYEGSVAWYRTSFEVAQAGTYALDFQSANYLASVWVDGRSLGSHKGSYLPFELRARLTAGAHTVVVRTDWRDPAQQSREGFHRTWFNWGGLDGEVDVRQIGESELSEPTIATTLTPDTPTASSAAVKVSVIVHNYGAERLLVPEGSLVHGAQTIPLSFPAIELARGEAASDTAIAQVPAPALWSPGAPNMYALTLTLGPKTSYSANVGLRQLTWHGGHAYLNGTQLLLHGASIMTDARGHGDARSPSDDAQIVDEL